MGVFTKKALSVLIALVLCIGAFSGCGRQGDNAANNGGQSNAANNGGQSNAANNTQPGNNAANTVPAENTVTAEWREGLKISYVLPDGLSGPDDLSTSEMRFIVGSGGSVCAFAYSSDEECFMLYHTGSERDLEGLTTEQKIEILEKSNFLVTGDTVDVQREKLENSNGCEVWRCSYEYEFEGSETEPFTDYCYFVRSGDIFSTFRLYKSGVDFAESNSGRLSELFKSMSFDSSGLHFSYDPYSDNSDETPFFYGLMDEEDRAVYAEIEAAMDVQKFEDGRDMEYIHESSDEKELARYWRIFECVSYEHPENIFAPSEWGNTDQGIRVLYRHAPDKYNDGDVEKRLGWLAQIEESSDRIIAEMPQNLTRYGKYMYLARALAGMVEYDYDDLDATVVREDPGYPSSLIGVYIYGKAVCEGYSQAYAYLCKRAGLFCTELIAGEHAWNIIRLNGELYYFDLTWMDSGDPNWYRPNSFDDLDQDHKDYLEHIMFRNSDWQPSIDAAKKTGSISWAGEQ